jgi:hypothetical protein
VKVFDSLKTQFPGAEVYIGTSNKVEPGKSPFSFEEKRMIAKAHGIDPSRVLLANRPYHNMDYEANFNDMSDSFDPTQVEIFFAVGEKDVLQRFPMNNLDPESGLDMTVRGEPRAKYYQMINTYKQDPQPMSVRGYIAPIRNVLDNMEEVSSASAFRMAMNDAPDEESAKQIFTKQFGEMNNQVFDLVYKKIVGEKMSEDLNILRKMAGLEVQEDAPVEFETEVNPGKVLFLEPSKSSSKMSVANRFPEDLDPNDPEVKKEQFIQELMKSPAALLSEINERIDPKDENSLAVSTKLSKIIDKLSDRYKEGTLMSLDDDDKKFVMKIVQKSIKEMDLVAGDDSEPMDDMKPEPTELDGMDDIVNPMDKKESLDLSDIRSEYKVEEDVYANYITYIGPNGEKLGTEDYDGELEPDMMAQMASDEECKMLCDKHNIDHDDTVGCLKFDDGEATMQDGEELPDGTIAFYGGKEGSVEEGRVKDSGMDAAEAFYDKVSKYVDDQNDIEQAIISAWEDSEDNPPDWALDDETKDILVQNNLLEPEMEEPEMEEGVVDEVAGAKDCWDGYKKDGTQAGTGKNKGKRVNKCVKEDDLEQESFDHNAEQSREEEEYNKLIIAYENGEEDLAEVMGMSMQELDQEMTEYAMEHNLHMDDDRDEVVHGYIEQVVDNADWKDHSEPDQELTDDLNRLRKLSGLEETGTKMVNGMTVYNDGSPLSFSDWRSETERETGHPMKRSPEDQERDYDSYVNRVKG